jgi:glycosyltransferase involved in cell wall biosynthesis
MMSEPSAVVQQTADPTRVSTDILPGTARVTFSLSMLGWALNEEESLGAYIDRAGAFLAALSDDFELILIDDGSTDRTWPIAQDYRRSRPWLKLYRQDRSRGSGYNAKRALSLATKDYVFWQTVDWSYDLRYLAKALPRLNEVDILQGVRTNALTVESMVYRSDTAYKGVVSLVNYWLIRLLFRLPISDYQNVTVYPRQLIQSVSLESESSFTNPECLLKTWWRGATFLEVPVPFVKRQQGIGKGTRPRAVLTAIKDILYWWNRWLVLGRRADRGRGSVTRAE